MIAMGHLYGPPLAATAAAAALRGGKEPDYDVFGPAETIAPGMRYVTNLPRAIRLTDGLQLAAPYRTGAEVTLKVWLGGVAVTPAAVTLATASDLTPVPMSQIAYDFQAGILPAGARLEVEILSAPAGAYAAVWKGLKLAILGVPAGLENVAAPSLGRLPDLYRWTLTRALHPILGAGGAPLVSSYGSGVAYWPKRQTLLVLDNTTPRIAEIGLVAGFPYYRLITLSGWTDTEGLTLVHSESGVFAVSNENDNKIDLIRIPEDGSATITRNNGASGWLSTINPAIAGASNLGIEALAYDPATDRIFFAFQEADSDHGGVWNLYSVGANGSGLIRVAGLNTILNGLATQVNDMTVTATGTLLLATRTAYAGTGDSMGRLIEIDRTGRLIQHTTVPGLPYLEGVTVTPGDARIFLTSEPNGSGGAYLEEWTRPA